jgi:hypothetical protein
MSRVGVSSTRVSLSSWQIRNGPITKRMDGRLSIALVSTSSRIDPMETGVGEGTKNSRETGRRWCRLRLALLPEIATRGIMLARKLLTKPFAVCWVNTWHQGGMMNEISAPCHFMVTVLVYMQTY